MNRGFYKFFILFLFLALALNFLVSLPKELSAQESRHFSWLHPKPQGRSIRNIVTLDQDKWYGVTLSGDFIRTTDGGTSWIITDNINGVNLTTGNPFALYDLHMFDEKTGIVCGEDGLLARTSNTGLTWSKFTTQDSEGKWFDLFFVDAKTGFVSGEAGNGIKITTDAGLHWNRIASPSEDAFSIYAFDLDNIFVSSTKGRVFFTSNRGQSWIEMNTGSGDSLLKINFYDKATAIVCGTSGTVRVTNDRGLNWHIFETNLPKNTWYDIDFQKDETIIPVSESFAAENFPPQDWISLNNSGSSVWERSTVSPYLSPACAWSNFDPVMGDNILYTPELEITAGDKLTFYLRRSYTGTIFNWDSLEVFVNARGGSPVPLMRIGLNSKDTAASTYPPRIGTYKRYDFILDKFAGKIVNVGFRHKNTDGTGIRLDEVLVGTRRAKEVQRVYLTGNSFNIYRNTISPLVYTEQPWNPIPFTGISGNFGGDALTTAVLGEDSLIVAGENGFLNKSFSTTGNHSYTDRNTNNNLYDLWTDNGGVKIISVGSSGVVLLSQDAGNKWVYNKISDKSLYSISMIDENTGWIAGAGGYLYRTENGGKSWNGKVSRKALNLVFDDFREVNFVDPKVGWAFGDHSVIIKTTNGGESWSRQNSNLIKAITIYDSYMIDRNVGYFVGDHGIIEKTTNGGDNWVKQNYPNKTAALRNIYMMDALTGWVCGDKGILLKTNDGGENWDSVSIPYPSTDLYGVQFLDKQTGMVVGESGKTFRTSDGGQTWKFENSGGTDHYSLQIISPEVAYISSSLGNVIKYNGLQDDSMPEILTENQTPDKVTLSQNYPNPFNPSTVIKFFLPNESNVSLKIYDITGREIASLVNNETLPTGSYARTFKANDLPSGIYFYNLIINGSVLSSNKMLLVK